MEKDYRQYPSMKNFPNWLKLYTLLLKTACEARNACLSREERCGEKENGEACERGEIWHDRQKER